MTTDALPTTLLISATVASGLAAGLLYGFACAVMPGLKEVDDRAFVSALRSVNRRILNGWFLLTFVGSPVLTVAAGVAAIRGGHRGAVVRRGGRRRADGDLVGDHRPGQRAAATTRSMRPGDPAPGTARCGRAVRDPMDVGPTSPGRRRRQRPSARWSGRSPDQLSGRFVEVVRPADHRPGAADARARSNTRAVATASFGSTGGGPSPAIARATAG